MELTMENLLRENYSDNAFYTHVSLIQPRGKYQFNRQSLEEFWKVYCDTLAKTDNPPFGLAEKPQQYLPVLVDVDLKVNADNIDAEEDHLFVMDDVFCIIQTYQSILKSIVEDCTDIDLVCVLLEKPPYRIKNNNITLIKNGFHLHFPYLFLEKEDQEVHLIPRVKDELNKTTLFRELGVQHAGDVIDKSCCGNTWLLYGSKKEETAKCYSFSRVFDSSCEELTVQEAFQNYQIFDKNEKLINIRQNIPYFFPRIFSILPYGRNGYVKELKSGLIPPRLTPTSGKESENSLKKYEILSDDEALKQADRLLPLISSNRADDYNEWMTIGWALYNISGGSDKGLTLWLKFSQQSSDKFDETKCIYEWDRMYKTDMTIGTIKYYASIDSPGKYNELKKAERDKYLQLSLNGSHNDIAKVLYTEYAGKFVCASVANKVWFEFNGNIWSPMEDGVNLREKISSVVVDLFVDMGKELYDQLRTAEDKLQSTLINERIKLNQKIIASLKSAPFKDNVMKECREVFYDRRFFEKLDTNPHLIAFKNGIMDVKNYIFRAGRPEDFLSKCMPINYIEFDPNDPRVIDVNDFLVKVFPDSSIRTFFKDVSSEVFLGGNFRKIVQMWTGEGDNGKSITQMFFDNMLGEYSIKAPTTLITSKKPMNGSAWPELVRSGGGVREITLDEPDENEEINNGIFKQLSGNDTILCRDLFQKGKDMREIKPLFKVKLICNKLPSIKGDRATWNRVRVIPFESTFCGEDDPCPDSYEEQLKQKRFPKDPNFAKKIPDLVEAFCWVLLNHGKTATKLKVEPEKVRAATSSYRRKNDIFRQFIEEKIKETTDEKDKLHINELYNEFKDWHRESMPNHAMPVKNDIKEYFSKIWGEPENNKWLKFRIKTMQDDIDDGKLVLLDIPM